MADRRDIPRPTVAELVALTDAEQVTDILAAARLVLDAVDAWRASPAWRPDHPHDVYGVAVAAGVRATLDQLGKDLAVRTVADGVTPLLGVWWPSDVPGLGKAVEWLRYLAKHRPRLAADARRVAALDPAVFGDRLAQLAEWPRPPAGDPGS